MAVTTARPTFHVYVIELAEAVRDEPKFRQENDHSDPAKPCLYVGQSARSPEVRFRQHRSGERSSRWVRDFGVRIVPELCRPLPEGGTREDAEEQEARLATELRAEGYAVWSR